MVGSSFKNGVTLAKQPLHLIVVLNFIVFMILILNVFLMKLVDANFAGFLS